MSNDSSTSSILGISRDRIFDGGYPAIAATNRARQQHRQVLAAVGLAAGDYAKAMITDCLSLDSVAKALSTASPSR